MVRLSQEERSALGRHAARIRQSLPPERRGGRKSTGSCLKGHRYTDANTARSPKGTPVCRTCRLARQRSRIKGLDQRTALFRLEVARPFGQPESGSRILWYSPRPKEDQAVMLPGAAVMAIDPGTNRRYYGTIIAFHPQYNQYTMRTEIDGETETIWVPVNLVFPIED